MIQERKDWLPKDESDTRRFGSQESQYQNDRFEPHIADFEMGNAYSELTDPVEQYERFLAQRHGNTVRDYEEHPIDMDFVHAIACGMPPTSGVGYGLDRLVMILTGKESIRDVIPFPMRMGKVE